MFEGLVVDNFYTDPVAVRAGLMEQSFQPPHPSGYGGPAWRCNLPPSTELVDKLSQLWGFPIDPLHLEARYNLASSTPSRGFCHSDFRVSDYTAVIYLSLPEHCQGGTNFFRHIGSNSVSYYPKLGQLNYADPDAWELVHTVDMGFNRMTTYPSKIFHGIKRPFFGTDIRGCATDSVHPLQSSRVTRGRLFDLHTGGGAFIGTD